MRPAALLLLLLLSLLLPAGGAAAATAEGGGLCRGTRCLAAFPEPADFQAARDKCSELAGHLMAVRTADAHAALRGALDRRAGPHWVGLTRPAGCPDPDSPDPAGPLRGFRWETGDRGSDFYNWAAAEDRPDCARQCVTVSSEDGFRWSAGSCDRRAAGFLCEYRRQDAAPQPPRLAACGAGYRATKAGGCADVDECIRAPCEHLCTNTAGSFTCSCFPRYRVHPEDATRCTLYCGQRECPAECDPNQQDDCTCPKGYIRDGRADGDFCVDIDECRMAYCDQLCANTFGGYACSCREGFAAEGGRCLAARTPDTDAGATPTRSVPTPDPAGGAGRVSPGGLVAAVVAASVAFFLAACLAYRYVGRRSEARAGSNASSERGEGHELEVAVPDEKAPPLET